MTHWFGNRSRLLRHTVACLTLLGWVAIAPAQTETPGATVAESAPISDLLQRARDGARRGDWKFTVDSLQRIIADPQGALISLDDGVYESARMQAYRELASLPPAGMEAYHLLYDGEAANLYRAAVASFDFEQLRRVVDRYLFTRSGRGAATRLAGWYIDLGKPGPAITILTDLQALLPADAESSPTASGVRLPASGSGATPEARGPRPDALLRATASAMLAVAYAQLDRGIDAHHHLERLNDIPGLSAEWRERSLEIGAYLQSRTPAWRQGRPLENWPMLYGGAARTGRMPATQPVLLEGLPWRYELPTRSPPPWSSVIERLSQDNRLLTSEMVIDEGRLYVKAGDRLIAIGLLNFEVDWISESPERTSGLSPRALNRIQRLDVWGNTQPSDAVAQESLLVDAALSEGVANQLSIGHGLIFEVVYGNPDGSESNWSWPTFPRNFRGRRPTGPRPNTLIARDLKEEGSIRWSLGAGFEAIKPPHPMILAGTPVVVGSDLLVIYWNGKDLFAGLLDPADGNELAAIYLCTMSQEYLEVPDLLSPAIDDQIAYIPTNSGLLLAMNVGDRSLRWASRYPRRHVALRQDRWRGVRIGPPSPAKDTKNRWLAGPPVVVGATILLAPPDSDQLYAFNRTTGRIIWNIDRQEHTYIVGADNSHLWLGGRSLAMVDIETGRKSWLIDTPSATGRAVLSGDRILLPTREGLASIEAGSGEKELQALPTDHPPLGNLLCWDGALYSIDSQQVRKFPDLEQSYEPAVQLHAADPSDATAAIRLAWMELLRKNPERVLQVLGDAVVLADTPAGLKQAASIAHLRVEALLASTKTGELSAEVAEKRLRQACELAGPPRDKLHATLALARQLTRNGKNPEAYQRLWHLAQTDEMDNLEEITPAWKRGMRAMLVDELNQLGSTLTEEQAAQTFAELESLTLLDVAPTRRNRRLVERVWDRLSQSDGNWNQLAALKLGMLHLSRKKYELAEYYLRKAAVTEAAPQLAAAATLELARMYVAQGASAARLARASLERLQNDFADMVLDGVSIGEVTQQLEEQVQADRQAARAGFETGSQTLSNRKPGEMLADGRLLYWEDRADSGFGEFTSVAPEMFYTFSGANQLQAYRLADGKRLWPARLRLPNETSIDEESVRDVPIISRMLQVRSDGQTMLINTQTGLHAVGSITGRRLWSIPIDVPEPRERNLANAQLFDVSDGMVVVRATSHQLDLRRVIDGDGRHKLWSAQIPDYIISSVRIVGNRVVAFDHSGLTAIVLDAHTGRRLFELTFTHAHEDLTNNMILTDDALCGVEGGALVCYNLADGAQRWAVSFRMTPVAMFQASADCVVLGGHHGSVLAIRTGDGRVVYESEIPFAALGIYTGHLQDGILFLMGRGEGADRHEVQLAAVNVESKQLVWVNTELEAPVCDQYFLRALPTRIPLLYPKSGVGSRNRPPFLASGEAALIFLDKRTGELAAERVTLATADSQISLTGEAQFWPGRVAIGTERGVQILPLPQADAPHNGGG